MGIIERKLREKENRRKDILDAAGKLFSGKKGMDATMDDLAELTELGKGTLYLYFPNKESILLALAGKGVGLLRKRLNRSLDDAKTGIEQISDSGDIFVEFLRDKPFYSQLLLKYEQTVITDEETGERSLLVEPVLEILKDILKKGRSDGTLRDDIDTYELVTILWSQLLGILNTLSVRKDILHIYNIDEDWIVKGHYRVILRGLMPA
ncbi:TetR/AcrR family transcriptional regulator [Maribellus sediminis]|uniref:TetR/AcrR family transcriptional regulator n=1 Tax=Maribellus sediminis TaxID=2696285 RepID=UPI0014312476|nr:TetR/AcrR family transcriptional regulator [Maribellus sediminis]